MVHPQPGAASMSLVTSLLFCDGFVQMTLEKINSCFFSIQTCLVTVVSTACMLPVTY